DFLSRLVRPGALCAGGLACLVEPVIGGAPVPADVAVGKGGDRVLDLRPGGHPGPGRPRRLPTPLAALADQPVRGGLARPPPPHGRRPPRPAPPPAPASSPKSPPQAVAACCQRVSAAAMACCDAASSSSSAATTAAGTTQPSPGCASMTRYSRWPRGRTGGNRGDKREGRSCAGGRRPPPPPPPSR